LINHPLDCPICDQGGECDLQDQSMAYGVGLSRFKENKRAVRDKSFGPLVKAAMTRCIHCTRCIRFLNEVAGAPEMGATGRGEHTEVGTYVYKALSSELSGNIIDLCPVGALTSKPYAFAARPWELNKTETIDVMDAVGSSIRVDCRGAEVMRILPRLNEEVNEEWISDKTRFAYDGLKRQRLDRPYVRQDGKLRPASWDEALAAAAGRLKGAKGQAIAAIAGDLADCESMTALKDLMAALASPHTDCRQDGARLDASCRAAYLFNTTIAGIEEADACLIIGSNPRLEAPIINARLRKRYLMGGFDIAVVGPGGDLTYKYDHLGGTVDVLDEIAGGGHKFAKVLKKAKRPMLILGQGGLARPDGANILYLARKIARESGMILKKDGWNGFNVLHTAAARAGGMDLGFLPGHQGMAVDGIIEGAANGSIEVVYLLGADEIDMGRLGGAFVIYQGHHGDAGAARADVVLPGAAYTEKSATYVNTEGRVQSTRLAVFPPGEGREDWKIIRALSEAAGHTLSFDNVDQLRRRMVEINPVFAAADSIKPAPWKAFGRKGKSDPAPFMSPVDNFYMTDPICRASVNMAMCTEAFVASNYGKTGTDG
ncbi:MAG: NADH-quinone oxidoreductase subunit NuoG, partial [Rhodospirillales bacterium]